MAEAWFHFGQIGAGKSLYATIKMCETLEKNDRLIVTNVPLIFHLLRSPEQTSHLAKALVIQTERAKRKDWKLECEIYWTIQEYCEKYARRPITVSERVIWLDNDQSREFYCYVPANGKRLTPEQCANTGVMPFRNESDPERACYGYVLPTRSDPLRGELCDFSQRCAGGLLVGGADYWIDEMHKLFPARNWNHKLTKGAACEDYCSELRKVDDNFFPLSQHPEKADLNIRRNMTGWVAIQNMGRTKLLMGVTLEKKFNWAFYGGCDMPGRNTKPDSKGWFSIGRHKRYEFLYRTMYGSSMRGGGMTETRTVKGNHWLVWVIAAIALFFICRKSPEMIESVVNHGFSGVMGGAMRGANKAMGVGEPPPAAAGVPSGSKVFAPPVGVVAKGALVATPATATPAPTGGGFDSVYCSGVVEQGSNSVVFLSNGQTAYGENGEIQGIGRNFVRVFGLPPIKRVK